MSMDWVLLIQLGGEVDDSLYVLDGVTVAVAVAQTAVLERRGA